MRLNIPCGISSIIKNNRDRRLMRGDGWGRGQLLSDLSRFFQSCGCDAVGAQQTCMHLFLRKWGLSPAEKANRFCTMGKGFPSPKTHHAIQRRRVIWRPIDRTRLLLHHPPTTFANSPVKVMMESLKIGVTLACVVFFIFYSGANAVL